MEQFRGLGMYVAAAIPVSLLLTAIFYMGYRKSCKLVALILTQLFAFFSIMFLVTLLGIYQVIPTVVMVILYLAIMLLFYVGGSAMTGMLVKANAMEEKGQDVRGKEEE
jgi:hypothetical protein